MTDITVLSYEDDPEFFQEAQASILSQILSQQSMDVQNVSGATYSCNGIIDAVANALGIEKTADAEQQGEVDSQAAADSEETDDAASTPEVEGNNNSTLDLSSLADGTYQGEGTGFRGTTSVSVTVEHGKITDITVVSYEDDEPFFARAEDTIIGEIIDTQSLDVSSVSGATFSSNGILEAVANALNVNFENPNPYNSRENGHERGDFQKPERRVH